MFVKSGMGAISTVTDTRFGQWLAERLDERGILPSQLAAYINTDPSTVGRWLSGQTKQPSAEMCARIAKQLMRPLDEVLAVAGYRPKEKPAEPPEIFAAHADKLTDDQWAEVARYAEWILDRDRKRNP